MSDISAARKIVQYGVSEVYSAPDPQVDIVFVHGLNGHPHHTWASRNPATFWPGDLLPLDLEEQRARILTYGYDANVGVFMDGASKDNIHNHAEHLASRLTANRSFKKATERPIIFVCHSLGGLVVKRCLMYCKSVDQAHTELLRSIYISTYGILFLGTPHNGSDLAKWGVLLQSICDAVLPKKFVDTSPQLIKALKTNNETLQNINRLFIEIIGRYRLYFFHESKPTEIKGRKEFVVDEESSAPIIEGVERMGIERDHSHMCKFEDENAPGYDLVAEAVQRYSEDAPATVAKRWIEEKGIRYLERREAAQELLGDSVFQFSAGENTSIKSGAYLIYAQVSETVSLSAPSNSLTSVKVKPRCEFEEVKEKVWQTANDWEVLTTLVLQNSSRPSLTATPQDSGRPLLIAPLGFKKNSLFFGFQIELDQLRQRLFSRKKRSIGTSAVLLWGPPGCGKTHLAREFVWRIRDDFPHGVFWIDCESQEAIHKSIWDIAQAVAILDAVGLSEHNQDWDATSQYVQAVRRWFEAREGWLIVFDGVTFDSEDDIQAFIKFIPDRTENGIIFTSIDRTSAQRQRLLLPHVIKVSPLSVDDARRLLYKELDIKRPTSTQEAQATELVKYFGCLPLAIHATGHMLSATGKVLEKYRTGNYPASKRLTQPYTEIIQNLWDNKHQEAINMINLLSFFGHSVPVAMLQLGSRALDDFNVEIRALDRERSSTSRDLESTIATLMKYGLAERTLQSFNTVLDTRGSLKAQLNYVTRAESSPELTWDATEADTKRRGSILESSPIRSTTCVVDVLHLHTVVQGVCRDEMRSKDKEKLWWWLMAAVGLFCLSYSSADERIKAADGPGLVRDYREYETHAARLYSHFPKDQNMKSTNLQKARYDLRKVMRSIKREIEDNDSTHLSESARHQVNISIFERTNSTADAPETPKSTLSRSSTWGLEEQTQTESPRKLRLTGREAIYDRAESGYDSFPEDYDYESGFESLRASIVTERRPSIPENTAGHDKSRPESTGSRTSPFLQAILKGDPIQAINRDFGLWRSVPVALSVSPAEFRATASKASSPGPSSSRESAARPNPAGSRAEAALAAIHRSSPAASKEGHIRFPSRGDLISAKRTNARVGNTRVSGLVSDASFPQFMRDRQAAAGSGPNRDHPSLPVEENRSVASRIPPLGVPQPRLAAGWSSLGVISQQSQYILTGYTSQPMSRDASQESAYSLTSAPEAVIATSTSLHSPTHPAYIHPEPAADADAQFPRMGGWSELIKVSPPRPFRPLGGSGDGTEQFGSSSPANLADDRPRPEGHARSLELFERGDFRLRRGIGMVERPSAALRAQMEESQRSNAIKSVEQREDDLIQAILFGGRDLPQSQVDNIVRQLVDERVSLTSFLEHKPDAVRRLFPWAPGLLDEGFSCAEVSELIINSENLRWLESENPTDDKDRSWAQAYSPSHLTRCAHEICGHARKRSTRTGNVVSKTEQSLSELNMDMVSESEVALHQGEPATVHSSSSRSSLSDLEDQFSKLEEREHNMTSICGTAGVFSPSSRPSSLNPGSAVFTGAIAKILYAESEQASEASAVKRQYAGSGQASQISCALDNVIYAISKLNRDGGCCDSFSIFVHDSSRPRTVRASIISRHMIESFQGCLKECLNTDFADSIRVANLADRCLDFFSTVGQSRIAEEFLRPRSDLVLLSNKCRHLCALVAQIASVGIVTYTRGHSREFVCDQLSRSVEKFLLLGTVHTDISVTATRVRLTCLDAMLSRPVWAFQIGGSEVQNLHSRFSVSTSIERLLDLWGGRLSFLDVPDDPGIVVQVGGGTLTEAPMPADTYRGAVLCHWSPSVVLDARPIVLKLEEQMIIGATLVNNECSLSADLCHSHISSSLDILGARSPRWKTTGRNVGLSGGQYITATMGVTQTKDNGRTRKARILEHWKDHKSLKILNEPVGLELSLCTGVARRVPLRTLFHSQVLEYFMSALDDWKSVTHQASGSEDRISVARLAALIGETTTNAEMHMLLDDVRPEQAEVLKKATELLLLAMECTGVAEDGESLVMWWPEMETPTPRGLKIPKRYYSASSKHGPWTSMIKDSESCAVFGMVTSRCLQHHGLRPCQTLGQVAVSYKFPEAIVLDTSLSPAGKDLKAVSVSYELGQRLLLWQRKEVLRVTRAAQKGEDVVRLELYAALPPAVARLIGSKWKLVREQQALKDQGQNVLVL